MPEGEAASLAFKSMAIYLSLASLLFGLFFSDVVSYMHVKKSGSDLNVPGYLRYLDGRYSLQVMLFMLGCGVLIIGMDVSSIQSTIDTGNLYFIELGFGDYAKLIVILLVWVTIRFNSWKELKSTKR